MSKYKIYMLLSAVSFLLATIIVANNCLADDDKEYEPPFPHLINPEQLYDHTVHLVAESISDDQGYETTEEYVDFFQGKSAFTSTTKKGPTTAYVDSQARLVYHYRPYTCIGLKPAEMEISGYEGLWKAEVELKTEGESPRTMYLYGVSALWLNAGKQAKTYSKAKMIYSASKDVFRDAHKWTVEDVDTKTLVHLFFIKGSDYEASQRTNKIYSLEMIQIESTETRKIKRTINILSVGHHIGEDIYNNLLQVPVGYGCVNMEVTNKALVKFPALNELYVELLSHHSHRIRIEATATKFEQTARGGKSFSDTISVELVRSVVANVGPFDDRRTLQLIRHRDTRQDTKRILDYGYNVQYKIDLRSGTCEMSNMGPQGAESLLGDSERVNISFANGLSLFMDEQMMHSVFVDNEDFYFIKQIYSGSRYDHLYFEKFGRLNGKPCLIIRVFSVQLPASDTIKLERVTLWIFDEKRTQIIESFHLNIIDIVELNSGLEMAKIFDVSEECYLNNDKMRSGRDFAWFQLNYPLSARYSQILSERSLQLKEEIYARFNQFGHLNFFRAPRMELMFEDTGFILRILLLDIPSIPLIYDMVGHAISMDQQVKEMEDLTVDLDHCADLCRLNQCKTMSYCESTHACMVTTKRHNEGNRRLFEMEHCSCYSLPQKLSFGRLSEVSLNNIISSLQHIEYEALTLPKVPDELAYPRSETGIDDETRRKLTDEFKGQLYVYLNKEHRLSDRLPMIILILNVDDTLVVLPPDRFELEDDPLKEFRLNGKDSMDSLEDQDDKVPPFHQGLSIHRYRMSSQSLANPESKARLFSGLNYDQCSLACVDSKCSSFSYCQHRQECIITDIYNVSQHMDLVEVDFECFIAQRDFLHKFNRFQGVYRPEVYIRTASALNPSECAHSCMIESEFRCLAFDFCQAEETNKDNKQLGTCFYQNERALYTGIEGLSDKSDKADKADKANKGTMYTGCDHYSRSYLADFVRIEYRKIAPAELDKLKTTLQEGRSVDQCADACVNELIDCTAFQFCLDPDTRDGPLQSCIMIESKPEDGNEDDYQVVMNQTVDGKIVKAGKFFYTSNNCHVFSLRRETSEAHLRDLAINSMTSAEYEANGKRDAGGLSVGGGILLYTAMTLVFAAIGCGVNLAKNHNDYLRHRMERLRILAGF